MNNIPIYNFVIIGKSGVGKSSLINYFFNSPIAKSGEGAPVTAKVFEQYCLNEDKLHLNIFDSWGIEAGKTTEWIDYFQEFLSKRKSTILSEWIHTAIYCFSGDSKRIERFEVEIINKLIQEQLNPIIVVTKSDLDKGGVFRNKIQEEFGNLTVVSVCNIEGTRGLGVKKIKSHRSGLEELKTAVFKESLKSFETRFKLIVDNIIYKARKNAPDILHEKVDEIIKMHRANFLGNYNEQLVKKIEAQVKDAIDLYDKQVYAEVNTLYENAVHTYGKFVNSMDYSIVKKKENGGFNEEGSDFMNEFTDAIINMFGKNPYAVVFLLPSSLLSKRIRQFVFGVDKEAYVQDVKQRIVEIYTT